jgi:hypothetical protein
VQGKILGHVLQHLERVTVSEVVWGVEPTVPDQGVQRRLGEVSWSKQGLFPEVVEQVEEGCAGRETLHTGRLRRIPGATKESPDTYGM